MSEQELKPCPFCGNAAFDHAIEPHEHHMSFPGLPPLPPSTGSHVIECGSCEVGMIADTKEAVFAAWNRRAALASAPATPAGEASGWKLVPVEPTEEMLRRILRAFMRLHQGMAPDSPWEDVLRATYREAIAAAPAATQQAACKSGLPVATQQAGEEAAYRLGWRRAAEWANRDDLAADVDSQAFSDCMRVDLKLAAARATQAKEG